VNLSFANQSFIDLGTYGEMYQIKEKDLMKVIKDGLEDVNQTKMRDELEKSIKKYFQVKSDITHCLVTKDRYFNPEITLEQDIDLSEYGVFIKKGEKYNPLKEGLIPNYILFLDADDETHIILGQKFQRQAKGSVMVIVTNGNIMNARTITEEVYKFDEAVRKSFNLHCVPSIYVQQHEQFLIREFAIQKKDGKDIR
jgi:conjugal transfer pilus assembly protein TraW